MSAQCQASNSKCIHSSNEFNHEDIAEQRLTDTERKQRLIDSVLEVREGHCDCEIGFKYHETSGLGHHTVNRQAKSELSEAINDILEQGDNSDEQLKSLSSSVPKNSACTVYGCCLPIKRFNQQCAVNEECSAADVNMYCGERKITDQAEKVLYQLEEKSNTHFGQQINFESTKNIHVCQCDSRTIFDQDSALCVEIEHYLMKHFEGKRCLRCSRFILLKKHFSIYSCTSAVYDQRHQIYSQQNGTKRTKFDEMYSREEQSV